MRCGLGRDGLPLSAAIAQTLGLLGWCGVASAATQSLLDDLRVILDIELPAF